ncbi:hypothetical protein FSST1_010523 [Fusarium sambucinum]
MGSGNSSTSSRNTSLQCLQAQVGHIEISTNHESKYNFMSLLIRKLPPDRTATLLFVAGVDEPLAPEKPSPENMTYAKFMEIPSKNIRSTDNETGSETSIAHDAWVGDSVLPDDAVILPQPFATTATVFRAIQQDNIEEIKATNVQSQAETRARETQCEDPSWGPRSADDNHQQSLTSTSVPKDAFTLVTDAKRWHSMA